MKAHITYGTEGYLESLYDKAKTSKGLTFLTDGADGMLIYETEGTSFFKEGTTYDISFSEITNGEAKYGVAHYIAPFSEDISNTDDFIKRYITDMKQVDGFVAGKLYVPTSNGKIIFLSYWTSQAHYLSWQQTPEFASLTKIIQQTENNPETLFSGGSLSKGFSVSKFAH